MRVSAARPGLAQTIAAAGWLRELPTARSRLFWLAIIQAEDHSGIGDDDGISALLGRNRKPALHGVHRHRAVRQFFRYRLGVDGFGYNCTEVETIWQFPEQVSESLGMQALPVDSPS